MVVPRVGEETRWEDFEIWFGKKRGICPWFFLYFIFGNFDSLFLKKKNQKKLDGDSVLG